MKVWIEVPFSFKNKTGIGNYFINFLKMLDDLGIDNKTISVEHKMFNFLRFRNLQYKIWLNIFLFIKAYIEKPDFIIFSNIITPVLKRKQTKYLTTIHDLTPYIENTLDKKIVSTYISYINTAIKKSDLILTVSETVKKELIEKFKISENRIKILYNTYDKCFLSQNNDLSCLDLDKKYKISKNKYILSVATLFKRKNLTSLIKAFNLISDKYPDLKLLLVGDTGNAQHIIKELINNNKKIIITGYIKNDDEISILYQNALMYVFPSIYEGFGIPIIEAQTSKTPLIVSDIPVFREIAGDGALFCQPDSEGIAKKIEELINNKNIRMQFIEKGIENIKRFDFEIIKSQIKEILNS
ncbi:MAG: glycosyltransferase family 1 protein [bacterium]